MSKLTEQQEQTLRDYITANLNELAIVGNDSAIHAELHRPTVSSFGTVSQEQLTLWAAVNGVFDVLDKPQGVHATAIRAASHLIGSGSPIESIDMSDDAIRQLLLTVASESGGSASDELLALAGVQRGKIIDLIGQTCDVKDISLALRPLRPDGKVPVNA